MPATEDGSAALTVLQEARRIDLVLTDLVLAQDMNRNALASEVRKHHPAAKVVSVSGSSRNATGRSGAAKDGSSLIGKPFKAVDLAPALRAALDEVEA